MPPLTTDSETSEDPRTLTHWPIRREFNRTYLYGKNQQVRRAGIIAEAADTFCENGLVQSITKVVKAYQDSGLHERLEKHNGENIENAFEGWANV